MGTLTGHAYHPITGEAKPVYQGWSWPAFLFGGFWCLYKKLWAAAGVLFGIALVSVFMSYTGLIALALCWTYMGKIGNSLYAQNLLKKGYVGKDHWEAISGAC